MNRILLANERYVGENELPFFIAEIGNNHNGSIELAKNMMKISLNNWMI